MITCFAPCRPCDSKASPIASAELPYARPISITTSACCARRTSRSASQSSFGSDTRSKSPPVLMYSGPPAASLRRMSRTVARDSRSAGTVKALLKEPPFVARAGSSSELSWRIPDDDVENAGPAPSPGCIRPAGPTSHKENTMAKYLLLKHYRGAPAPVNDVPMDKWRPEEVEAHIRFMNDFAARLESSGEFIDGQALSPDGVWVRYDGEGRPPVTDGPFAETKDLIAGWMVIDVDSYERAIELAGELSAAPGAGGEPIHEWLEVRPFLAAPPTVTQ